MAHRGARAGRRCQRFSRPPAHAGSGRAGGTWTRSAAGPAARLMRGTCRIRAFRPSCVGSPASRRSFRSAPPWPRLQRTGPSIPRTARRGMTRAAHAAALGLAGAADLSRCCDRATAERPAGAPLFWTLGANQTGKAAIAGWRDMLLPAFAAGEDVRLWPFDGPFRSLLAPGAVAIAETYPAEALRHLGLRMAGSKRRQPDRAALAAGLNAAMATLSARPDDALGGCDRNRFRRRRGGRGPLRLRARPALRAERAGRKPPGQCARRSPDSAMGGLGARPDRAAARLERDRFNLKRSCSSFFI